MRSMIFFREKNKSSVIPANAGIQKGGNLGESISAVCAGFRVKPGMTVFVWFHIQGRHSLNSFLVIIIMNLGGNGNRDM
jgi:hypothetical protein